MSISMCSLALCMCACACVRSVSGVAPVISRCVLRAASDVITHLVTSSSPTAVSYVRTDTLTLACDVTGVPPPECVYAQQGLRNGRVSVRPSVRPSVCPVDRQQQRRAAGLLLSAGACSRYRSMAGTRSAAMRAASC